MSVKTIKYNLDLSGFDVVQTGGDEKAITYLRTDVEGQKYDNITYAKGNFVIVLDAEGKPVLDSKGRPKLRKILKISGDGLRHAIHIAAMPANTPNILLSPESRIYYLASLDAHLRGWLVVSTEERKRSSYTTTSAEDPNAVLAIELFSNSAPKVSKSAQAENADGSTRSDTSLFFRETTGTTNYSATGFVDIEEIRFVSFSDIYGRRAITDDLAEAYRAALSANIGSEVDRPRYWRRRDGASNIPERGILLTDAQVRVLITHLFKRMSEIHITKSSRGYADASKITITVVEDNRIDGDTVTIFDGSKFDADSIPREYRCIWDEVTEERGRAEVEAFDAAIAADRKSAKATKDAKAATEKAAKTAAKAKKPGDE